MFLLVAGRPQNRARDGATDYRGLSDSLDLSNSVFFHSEYIPDAEVPDYFELCDWVAMPYGGRFSSQSGVLNLAMAHRRPVLITGTPTISETLATFDVGVMVAPDDLEALRNGIAGLLSKRPGAFGSSIEDYLKSYSWEKNAQLTADTYRACLAAPQDQDGVCR